jgi:hypothetical protein
MKDYTTLKPYPLIVTIFVFLVFVGGCAAASETAPVAAPVAKGSMSPLLWGGIGLGFVTVLVILYFVFANMERKITREFKKTIVDDIVSAVKMEYELPEKDLRELAADIVSVRRCSDPRLASLLRVEYEVEKINANSATRTTAVAIKKQNDIIVKKATRTLPWEDLPRVIRKEFILKNEKVLVYSLYCSNEKEVVHAVSR